MEIKFIKEQDDPLCTRISAGGNEEIGYYCVYRGELEDVKRILNILINKIGIVL